MTTTSDFHAYLERELTGLGVTIRRHPKQPGRILASPKERVTPDLVWLLKEFQPEALEWIDGRDGEIPLAVETDPLRIIQRMDYGAVVRSWTPALAWEWIRQLILPASGAQAIYTEGDGSIDIPFLEGCKDARLACLVAFLVGLARDHVTGNLDSLRASGWLKVIPKPTPRKEARRG